MRPFTLSVIEQTSHVPLGKVIKRVLSEHASMKVHSTTVLDDINIIQVLD